MMNIVNVLVGLVVVGLAVTVRVQKQIMKIQQQAFEGLEEIIVNQQATIDELQEDISRKDQIIDSYKLIVESYEDNKCDELQAIIDQKDYVINCLKADNSQLSENNWGLANKIQELIEQLGDNYEEESYEEYLANLDHVDCYIRDDKGNWVTPEEYYGEDYCVNIEEE